MIEQVHSNGFLVLGGIILAVVWLPVLVKDFMLTLPMIAVALGFGFFQVLPQGRFFSDYRSLVQLLLEFVLIVAVMGAGLKIDRPFGLRSWSSTWRLLGFGMPLYIAATAGLAMGLLNLPLASAVLMAAILSPTDPVLASNVQVGPPGTGEEGEVRFALTSEAGLNDGLAYPFVTLGLLLWSHHDGGYGWLERWVLVDVLWKLVAAIAVGFLVGRGITWINQRIPGRFRLSRSNNGLAAVGIGLLAYGISESIGCYGFVAVFTAAATIRNTTRNIRYTRDVHSSAAQIEQLVMFLVLVMFGGAIAEGLLASLTLGEVVFALLALFVLRPVVMQIGYVGSDEPIPVRLATGFFGTRGIGTLYYTAYIIDQTHMADAEQFWRVIGLIVLLSIFVFGASATPIMRRIDTLRDRALQQAGEQDTDKPPIRRHSRATG